MSGSARRIYAQHRVWIVGILIALAANLGFRVAVNRVRAAAEAQEQRLEASRKEIVEARADWDRVMRLQVLLELADAGVQRLHEQTLETRKARFVKVDQELKNLAKEFGLSWTSVRNDTAILPDQGVERFTTSFPVKGGYQNLRKFISFIEGSEQFFIIEKVTLADSTERGAELNLQISVVTYFALPEGLSPPRGSRRGA